MEKMTTQQTETKWRNNERQLVDNRLVFASILFAFPLISFVSIKYTLNNDNSRSLNRLWKKMLKKPAMNEWKANNNNLHYERVFAVYGCTFPTRKMIPSVVLWLTWLAFKKKKESRKKWNVISFLFPTTTLTQQSFVIDTTGR